MIKHLFLFITLAAMTASFSLQAQVQGKEDPLDDYEWRIQQDYLMGVYIPENEEDAFRELQRLGEDSGLNKFRHAPEDSIRRKLHFGLGKWMMKNWQLIDGSRLSHHLKQEGLLHPDDMVEYLIVTFHRHLNDEPLESSHLIEEYNEARKQDFKERRKQIPTEVIDTLSRED
jgi:hypothetical protein